MNLRQVLPNRWNPVRLRCLLCGILKDSEQMMADLDGEPFKTFYCHSCSNLLETVNKLEQNIL